LILLSDNQFRHQTRQAKAGSSGSKLVALFPISTPMAALWISVSSALRSPSQWVPAKGDEKHYFCYRSVCSFINKSIALLIPNGRQLKMSFFSSSFIRDS